MTLLAKIALALLKVLVGMVITTALFHVFVATSGSGCRADVDWNDYIILSLLWASASWLPGHWWMEFAVQIYKDAHEPH